MMYMNKKHADDIKLFVSEVPRDQNLRL